MCEQVSNLIKMTGSKETDLFKKQKSNNEKKNQKNKNRNPNQGSTVWNTSPIMP